MTIAEAGGPGGDHAAFPPGTRLEEYRIERCLGGGGFGITYLAWDDHLELPVAIKEYFPADMLTRTPQGEVVTRVDNPQAQQRFEEGLQRFIDEARALAAFRHPHIVRVLRYFRARGTAYIVMEYESGQSLKQWLPRHGPLTLASLLAIAMPLLDGLEAVHTAGFLHRDIKPDNIYVRTGGSPVLLDFGAARRLHASTELTNIVSPGFAPFEQYHSQGDQGPWSDIYAFGAVLYWMITGRKPLEAAARVQSDTLPAACAVGDVAVFGIPVLQAIDWALHPQEKQRPQSVAQLRAALRGNARPAGTGLSGQAPADGPTAALGPGRGNLLCTILFLDLVGYSARSVDDQAVIKRRLNALITRAIQPVPAPARLVIDTGDGAAVCFLGDPEDALQSTLLLRDLLGQRPGTMPPARFGLHMGPVRIVTDINQRTNVIGDGINVAQRIMDFAQPHQVMVSRAYYDVISRIANDTAGLFRYAGAHMDKHGRSHELHAVQDHVPAVWEERATYTPTVPSGRPTGPTGAPQTAGPSPPALAVIEQALCRHIGPMGAVLMQQALAGAGHDPHLLVGTLAAHIEGVGQRNAFRQAALAVLSPPPGLTRLRRSGAPPQP